MIKELYSWPYCKFTRAKTLGVLLFNALNPLEKVDFIDVHLGDTRVRRASSVFGGKNKIKCPSTFYGDVFTIGVLDIWHEYNFLKNLR